jgi:membrane-bound serine protease (ClpP class)
MITLGIVCVVIAVILLLFEAHLSTGGLIAALAVGALVGGVSLLLVGSAAGLIAVLAVSGGVCVSAVGGLVLLSRRLRPVRRIRISSGAEAMVGRIGVMRTDESADRVFVDGALWRAQPSVLDEGTILQNGDRVVIEHVNGLTLRVRKAEELELNR